MNKKVIGLVGITMVALVVVGQEIQPWISGGQMYANLVKAPRFIGGSEIAVTPEVIAIGTNAAVVEGKFYVLTPENNWVLASSVSMTTCKGLIGLAHGTVPSHGMILKGDIYSTSWTNLVIGDSVYISLAGAVSTTVPDYVRYVGALVGPGIIRIDPAAIPVYSSSTSL